MPLRPLGLADGQWKEEEGHNVASVNPLRHALSWFPPLGKANLAQGAWQRAGVPALPGHMQDESLLSYENSISALLLSL